MVKITDKYSISADSNCYVLQELSQVESGKNAGLKMFKPIGYYSSIESALNGLKNTELRNFLKTEDVYQITDLCNEIKRLEKLIKERLGGK